MGSSERRLSSQAVLFDLYGEPLVSSLFSLYNRAERWFPSPPFFLQSDRRVPGKRFFRLSRPSRLKEATSCPSFSRQAGCSLSYTSLAALHQRAAGPEKRRAFSFRFFSLLSLEQTETGLSPPMARQWRCLGNNYSSFPTSQKYLLFSFLRGDYLARINAAGSFSPCFLFLFCQNKGDGFLFPQSSEAYNCVSLVISPGFYLFFLL